MKLLIFIFMLFVVDTFGQTIFVSRVVDGDTFKDSTGLSYRLIGINAPESHDKGGPEATHFLDSLINHKYIQIVTDKKYDTIDFYKRKLCYIFYNGIDINKLMIKTGHAIAFTKYPFGKTQEYVSAEKEYTDKITFLPQSKETNNVTDKNFLTNKNIKTIVLITLVIILMVIGLYFYKK